MLATIKSIVAMKSSPPGAGDENRSLVLNFGRLQSLFVLAGKRSVENREFFRLAWRTVLNHVDGGSDVGKRSRARSMVSA